jgi:hypothetical protein
MDDTAMGEVRLEFRLASFEKVGTKKGVSRAGLWIQWLYVIILN